MEKIKEVFLSTILGGVVGALLVGAFYTWPYLYDAKWWELFTALGTVGATALALYFGLASHRDARAKLERRRKVIALNLSVTLQEVENAYNLAQIHLSMLSFREQMGSSARNLDANEVQELVSSLKKSKKALLRMSLNDASLIEGLVQSIDSINSKLNEAARLIKLGGMGIGDFSKEVKDGSKCFYSAVDEVAALRARAERIINS